MNSLWFFVLGAFLIAYAIFDGMTLGLGAMHIVLGRTPDERKTNFAAIGPFWFGYEVWLLAAGGSMVSAFPDLYAKSFSGFYLVLNIVLWLLIVRGSSIEFRHQVQDEMWQKFWDVCFCVASALLAVFFGAAVGNVLRGVPFDSSMNFIGSLGLALNPYAILVGVLSLIYLCLHGSLLVMLKTGLDDQRRFAQKCASVLFIVSAVLIVAATAAAALTIPGLMTNFQATPILWIVPVLTVVGLISLAVSLKAGRADRALLASALALGALMMSAGVSLYPSLLPDLGRHNAGLTIGNVVAPDLNLVSSSVVAGIGMIFVIVYAVYIHKVFAGRVELAGDHY